jgi:hypothetical protein
MHNFEAGKEAKRNQGRRKKQTKIQRKNRGREKKRREIGVKKDGRFKERYHTDELKWELQRLGEGTSILTAASCRRVH